MTSLIPPRLPMHPEGFYHICFAVPDLAKAMTELSEMLGVTFGQPFESQLGDWPYTLVFTDQAPHIELICGGPGSPWETSRPVFHHLGWWTPDLAETIESWTEAGGAPYFDGRERGRRFAYIDAPNSGARLEAVDLGQRKGFLDRWKSKSRANDPT